MIKTLVLIALAGSLVVTGSTPRDQAGPPPRPTAAAVAPFPDAPDNAGPRYPATRPSTGVRITDGVDWSMPAWARPAPNSGFYSFGTSLPHGIHVRGIDLSWRQLAPRPGVLDTTSPGSAQGMEFASLDEQLATPGPYWVRIFASGVDWAPEWVKTDCGLNSYGPDYDGQRHLPIWNDCLWGHLLETYRQLFVQKGLRSDPDLRLVLVPGAFTWSEYDYDMIEAALATGDLTWSQYMAWYQHAWTDLATLFGEWRNRLVFTGEDYPYTDAAGADLPRLATMATAAGLGIRTGIPEISNNHLSEAPAYGSHVQPNGHLTVDEQLPIHDGNHVIATENECYNACGYTTTDPEYAIVQSNLKSLQLRTNWMFVVPTDSYLDQYPQHWDWTRLSLGRQVTTSPDAWAELRDAEDSYWKENSAPPFEQPAAWPGKPWVRNLERWLVQRDVPTGVAHRSTVDTRTNVLDPANGTAHEGLSTALKAGDKHLFFDLDDRFVSSSAGETLVHVTYWDASGPFRLRTGATTSPTIRPGGAKKWRTATIVVPVSAYTGGLPGRTDLAIDAVGPKDVTAKLVRVSRLAPPRT